MSPVPLPGGAFFGPPLPPFPPSPRGSGFPQGSMLPPGAGCLHGSELPAMLLDFFLASSHASRGPGPGLHALLPGGQGQAFRLPCFQVSGAGVQASALLPALLSGDRGPVSAVRGPGLPDFQEARLSGARASRSTSMLLGGQGQGFLHAFRRQGFQASS